MQEIVEMLSINSVLIVVFVVTLLVWVVQEIVGRRYRIAQLCAQSSQVVSSGKETGFPIWLRVLSGALMACWILLGLTVYLKRDGDFALILVVLVFLAGLVSVLDRLFFRQRRVQLMGAASVQQVLSRVRPENEKQALIDWGETDFAAAEYAKSFFPVLLAVLVLRSFLLEPFKIPSASMVPTLQVHDFILVNKFAYGLRLPVLGGKILPVGNPERGDVMVFYPPNDKRYFIKRVIGLPGDRIRLVDNVLYINGVKMDQHLLYLDSSTIPGQVVMREDLQPREHLMQHAAVSTPQSNYETVVPEGQYFMMGDNRDNSSDSRFWGMVPERNVVGQAIYVWMHWGAVFGLPSFNRNGAIQ
ncbi:MAG TPA: signal peptidase I [Pseudomonadales bacterium]|nr:signal peptidase I [Pseudomonadales bacterium]